MHGACTSLIVEGSHNRVSAELAPRAQVSINGDDNQVRYHLVGGTEEARTAIAGRDDVVGPDSAPVAGLAAGATKPALELSAGGEADCRDRDVHITGSGGSYTLRGGCRSVTITGSGNAINAELQPQAGISAGQGNRITWFLGHPGLPPQVLDPGTNSQVLQQQALGSTVLPPSATPDSPDALVLTGEKPLTEADCGGRDAQITADNSRFVLRGRCRTISVTGSHDTVEAEMLSGSRIRIVGDHTTVQFALVDTGPDPIVSAQGDGSSAWRIQRLGASSRATASEGVSPTAAGMKVEGGQGAAVNEMNPVPQALPR